MALLSICDNQILFKFLNSQSLNVMFSIIIIICFIAYFWARKNHLYIKIVLVYIASICFLIYLFLILLTFYFSFQFIGCTCHNHQLLTKKPNFSAEKQEIKPIYNNKVIIVGDSRMEFIQKKSNFPINFTFVAKSGASIEWLKKEGMPNIEKILERQDSSYKYHILFNFGVNDLQYTKKININQRVEEYFELYKKLINQNHNVKFYILSINPIDENKINQYFPENIRTNQKIEEFNSVTKKQVNELKITNLKYCESYNSILFSTPDGLHYDKITNKKIVDYMINKCIEY